ncbi:alpha/beta hydrolase [Streptosporangium sp. NPDC004379]|uniref:alpha/beta hydrolase n=1 Tax=Streptosporangium sp. NPDC004379 TaxID=3366189 RepID=UPI00369C8B79
MTLVLIHGGLWEDGMDAERFWAASGVMGALRGHGLAVHAPDRPERPESWDEEASCLEETLPDGPLTVLGASNGCTTAVRLALTRPGHVTRLILAWPATCGDPRADGYAREHLAARGASTGTIDRLLAGQTLRGVTDAELAGLTVPVGVAPPIPNPFHRRSTVDALLTLVPDSVEIGPGTPEPPRPDFPAHREAFVSAVLGFVR